VSTDELPASGPRRYPVFIAKRFVRARRQGFLSLISLLSALGFFVGVLSLIVALALMTGFQQDVVGRILDSNAHILVQAAEGPNALADIDGLVRRIEAVPGVAAAEPVIHGYAGIVGPSDLVQWTAVTGIDPLRSDRVTSVGRKVTNGRLADLVRPEGARPGIVLGVDLARRLGARVGDNVRLIVPRPRLAPWGASIRQPTLQVVGVFAAGFNEYDQTWSFVSLDAARGLFDVPRGAHWIAVRTTDPTRIDQTRGALAAALGTEFLVDDVLSRNRAFFSALRLEKLLMFLAVGLIVLVAALGVVSTLVLTVTQKVREIGVLSAMGATPRGLMQIFVLQGLAMGIAGTLGGAAAGVGLCRVLDRFKLIKLDPDVYYLDHLPFTVEPSDLALVVGVAVVVAALATIYPAWRASRLDPVEALRRD